RLARLLRLDEQATQFGHAGRTARVDHLNPHQRGPHPRGRLAVDDDRGHRGPLHRAGTPTRALAKDRHRRFIHGAGEREAHREPQPRRSVVLGRSRTHRRRP
ncbi:MAG: hypothetical protein ACK559_19010, partial [bacterium]